MVQVNSSNVFDLVCAWSNQFFYIQKLTMPRTGDSRESVFRVPPYYYLHVLDQTSNVTRLEVGPLTFIRKDNEVVTEGPSKMIIVPPRHYCVVTNPVIRDEQTGEPLLDNLGQVRLHHADAEVRLSQEPFPLFPGEEVGKVIQLKVVPAMTALKLRVNMEFTKDGKKWMAGDEYLFEGPGTYIPRKEVAEIGTVTATIVKANEALKMTALRNTVDRDGISRVAGEEWMVRNIGPYLPGVYEEVKMVVSAFVLTDKIAIHVRANKSLKDQLGINRKTGEEYLITLNEMESFIPDVHEEVIKEISVTTLDNLQYCVILNPVGPDGKPQLGHSKIVRGEASFFLQPGESLKSGVIEDIYILGDDEGLVLKALIEHEDNTVTPAVLRKPGDLWMLKGPLEYTPTVSTLVVRKQSAIPLHENEGIYVRNTKTGSVRAVIGHTYLLGEHEELWKKKLPSVVRSLLDKNRDALADRGQYINPEKEKKKMKGDSGTPNAPVFVDDTKVITFQVPNNAAVQIYDYKSKNSRVVFGPDLVMLEPNEEFTQLSLSGGKPKRPNLIRSIALLLGPDYCSDIITVETSDHACLQLQLSYNWYFDVDKNDREQASKLFCVNDFIGDLCKAIASRIRGAVSSVSFDNFHKNSAKIIKLAVFGVSEGKTPNEELRFTANNCVVTSIDIRSVEPVDQKTRDSLQQSVTLAIEITTQSQEAAAKREAERIDQEARGKLERQKILDDAEAEKTRKELLELQAQSAAVESTGQAKAEASSRAESMRIEAEASVDAAKLKAAAAQIEANAELDRLTKARKAELEYLTDQFKLEREKASELAEIECKKFKEMVSTIGSDNLASIASGPQDHQVKLLQSLGLSSTLITDGRTPINLLDTAKGLLGNMNSANNISQ